MIDSPRYVVYGQDQGVLLGTTNKVVEEIRNVWATINTDEGSIDQRKSTYLESSQPPLLTIRDWSASWYEFL